MTRERKAEPFGKIILEYAYFLIDTCSFHGTLGNSCPHFLQGKLDYFRTQKELTDFWGEKIKAYKNCYTIPEVLQELKFMKFYNYKKSKERGRISSVIRLRKVIKEARESRSGLIKTLEKEQRILQFDREEQELYEESYERYLRFEEIYDLHGADYPLVISGKVMTEFRGPSAIISNDFGIVRAWDKISAEENLSTKDFGFFVRQGTNSFRRLRRG